MNADELQRLAEVKRDFDEDIKVLLVEFWETAQAAREQVGEALTRAQALGRIRGSLSKSVIHLLERVEDE